MSTLRVNTIQDAAGTGTPSISGLAKAWVNFNGTGTVAIRASYNVSSITDLGTGAYRLNFTTAMPDANYSCIATCGVNGSTGEGVMNIHDGTPLLTTSASVRIVNSSSQGYMDKQDVCVSVFR
jgi:hypothetical protein